MFRALSMNEIYSNGLKLYPFSGHSGFKVIHWETIVMKVHLTFRSRVIPCQINQFFAKFARPPSDFDEIWHT